LLTNQPLLIVIFDKISQLKKIVLFVVYSLPLVSHAQKNYWQQQVDFTINVSLNDIENTLDGFEKIQYSNNSPDTLHFIWIHLWPNAFKNDRTAFSEQSLQNRETRFYFSNKDERGYINHLDFRVNGEEAKMEDHPLYIDIIKIILPQPLLPGGRIELTTPFHEKIPFDFSRGGHVGHTYQITQWYPKPAVYDARGWHEMPYLEQGEYFSEFGNFDVRLTLPQNYVVAATGELQNEEEKLWLTKKRAIATKTQERKIQLTTHQSRSLSHGLQENIVSPSDQKTKTLVYKQNNMIDFAWFADKNFIVDHDTLQLSSGKIIDCYSFYFSGENSAWKKSVAYIKDAIRFHSTLIGEYPYSVASTVEAKIGFTGGMEYPTLTSISPIKDSKELDLTINHELGHNWFYGVLATDERRYPWMDEGMNTYYDERYEAWKYKTTGGRVPNTGKFIADKLPENFGELYIRVLEKEKLDQPVSTSSEDFTAINYNFIAYLKTGWWMQQLERILGRTVFDSCMRVYYREWQFKHPYPDNFRSIIENTSGKNLEGQFALLDKKGPLSPLPEHRTIRPAFLFNLHNTDQFTYINFLPAVGANLYDKVMIGAMIHNFDLPPNDFQFVLIPLYATGSRQLDGIGQISYSWYPDTRFRKITLGLGMSRFSSMSGTDSSGNSIFGGFYKFTPSLRFIFKNENPRSSLEKTIEWKTFIIGEKSFNYFKKTTDSTYYPSAQNYSTRYLNQLSFSVEDSRVLYPYDLLMQVQQATDFYRINFSSNYFFNYAKGGGMAVRFFAAKFGYIGGRSITKEFETERYQPKLTATRGDEDYTYENYFIGRSETTGFASQQIMMKDGGLKLRTDLFSNLQGRSDNWVTAINFNTTLPATIIPKEIPLRIFFDIGTYADAWSNNPPTTKFLYVGGLQLSLFRNLINIYAPLLYSSDFRNNLKSVPEENSFLKKLSFSIDIQHFSLKKLYGNIPL
jgi:hypothetical protein